MYTGVGVLRLGYLANFLSHSVISGFTSGAAIIIGLSQLKYFFGIKIPNASTVIEAVKELSKEVHTSRWQEMLMFTIWLVLLLVVKHVAKKYKRLSFLRAVGPISVAFLGIFFVKVLGLDEGETPTIKVVKTIPDGAAL